MFVLSYVLKPDNGASFGKATVSDPLPERKNLHTVAYWALRKAAPWMHPAEASRYAAQITSKDLGVESVEASTGLVFRIDPVDRAPNACPCCGRLVNFGDHALAGSDDAYCLGCFTWKRGMTPCPPENTAHHNPWAISTADARWYLEVVIDRGDETDSDHRYSPDAELLHDDPVDAALIAWPGLTRDQIIEATLTEINKES